MLTTAGMALRAASLKVGPIGVRPSLSDPVVFHSLAIVLAALSKETGLRLNHSGFKVATTNKTARQTVAVCAKINQSLRIEDESGLERIAKDLKQEGALSRSRIIAQMVY